MNSLIIILLICIKETTTCQIIASRGDVFMYAGTPSRAVMVACGARAGEYVKALDEHLASAWLEADIHPKACRTRRRAA